jgi:hypothetical protein
MKEYASGVQIVSSLGLRTRQHCFLRWRSHFYTYVGDFSAAMEAATGIDDKVLVQLFYDGAQPPWFRDYLKHLDSGQARRFSDLSDTVRQGIQHASLH